MNKFIYLCVMVLMCFNAAAAKPTVKDYALDANISRMKISPNGELIAYTKSIDQRRLVYIHHLQKGVLRVVDATQDKLRGYQFYDNEHLVLFNSITTRFKGYKGEYEYYASYAVPINGGDIRPLMMKNKKLLWPQTNFTRIVGPSNEEGYVLMELFTGQQQASATLDLYKVSLATGRGRLFDRGKNSTIDWFVDEKGTVRAREDYRNHTNKHTVLSLSEDDDWREIFEKESDIPESGFTGLAEDNTSLGFIESNGKGYLAYYHMELSSGAVSEAIFEKADRPVEAAMTNRFGKVIGVRYSGLQPSYDFYDPSLNKDVNWIVSNFPQDSVHIVSFSDDFSQVLLLLEGSSSAGIYSILDRNKKTLEHVADARSQISDGYVGAITAHQITTRDGMAINALLTLPPQIPAKDLPAVVMPHGGPESYDQISFDFMAQYFASQGYAVIQPNFRGSTGFGTAYKLAGRGEWGRKMQDDVTDSLKHFATQGVVDADRVCIVGASYGGYSALAGGAFTPELYKCVVAIAPVADLPLMMKDTQRYTSKYSWVRTYWDRVIQDGNADDDMLEAISPINHVNKFKAPVLLIHGNDDTVVPMKQSLAMEDALEDADKTVTFIELHKEDHYLSNPRTRLEALEATGSFVNKYLN